MSSYYWCTDSYCRTKVWDDSAPRQAPFDACLKRKIEGCDKEQRQTVFKRRICSPRQKLKKKRKSSAKVVSSNDGAFLDAYGVAVINRDKMQARSIIVDEQSSSNSGQHAIWQMFLHVAIYAAGTFYANPFKVVLNAAIGSRYAIAYAHFRRDHSVPLNIILHLLCLFIQVLGNFALLEVLDSLFFDFPWLSTLTAVAWICFLSMTPSPPSVKLASAASIAGAYAIRAAAASSFSMLALAQAPFEVACYWLILPYHGVARPKAAGLAALFVLRLCVWCALRPLVGWPGVHSRFIGNCLAVITLALGSLVRAKDNMPICEHLGLAAWAPAMLLDAPWLFFLCLSFVGQALQGVSHEVTGQEGTLPQLKDARHELAHCAYFPNLVFQSIHHSFTARAYLPTVASLGDYRDRRSRLAMGLKVE